MLTKFATAIYSLYTGAGGATLRAANTGGLWLAKGKDGVVEPFIRFNIVGSTIEDMMGAIDNRLETVDLQFDIFSKADDGGVQVADITDKLTALYDWATLTYTTFTHVACRRTGIINVGFVDEVWQNTALYEVTFKHN